jgi:hypothetical protein
MPPPADPVTLWLSCHVDYACRHSGACCRSGWPLPVEPAAVSAIDEAVVRGRVWTVDGRANWLDDTAGSPAGVAGTFRQVDGGCVFHAPTPPMTVPATARERYCGIHAALGHPALPSSCQHFPRVCLIGDRGVRVSLSHYCPTAASMLVDADGPVTVVAGPPALPGRAVPEGLDVRDGLPPRLTDDVLADHDGAAAWERHVVATLAGATREPTVERALARIAADARRLAEWRPATNTTLADAVSRLAMESSGHLDDMANRLGDPSAWPAWFAMAADACQGAWLADAPPAHLADFDARYVAPRWPAHAGAAGRYLAARAFGSWIAYQADAAVTLSRWLTLCHAVLRVESARACGAAERPLDRDRLVQAIRQADLLLVHYADSLAIARTLGNRSEEAASG